MSFDIHRAAFEGQTHLVTAALETDPNLINTVDADDRTLLHNACSGGSTSIVGVLLEQVEPKCDVEKKDSLGWTALIIASSAGSTEIVSNLVHHGVNVNACNEKGMTALHYAASKGRLEIGKLLIGNGADVNARDRANQLPLHRAASSGASPFIQLLTTQREDGAKPRLNLADRAGNTPLHLALESGHAEAACVLIEAGADRSRTDADGKRAEESDGVGGRERRRVLEYIEGRCGAYTDS